MCFICLHVLMWLELRWVTNGLRAGPKLSWEVLQSRDMPSFAKFWFYGHTCDVLWAAAVQAHDAMGHSEGIVKCVAHHTWWPVGGFVFTQTSTYDLHPLIQPVHCWCYFVMLPFQLKTHPLTRRITEQCPLITVDQYLFTYLQAVELRLHVLYNTQSFCSWNLTAFVLFFGKGHCLKYWNIWVPAIDESAADWAWKMHAFTLSVANGLYGAVMEFVNYLLCLKRCQISYWHIKSALL